jgi:IS5 family transposase
MPIETIKVSEKHGRLFHESLSNKLNPKNKLYKLSKLIDWESLETKALSGIEVKQYGRNKKCSRVMLGLLMLQAMYNGSDSYTESELMENIYWQYFCGTSI